MSEIEELRHAGSQGHETTAPIDKFVTRLDAALSSIQERVKTSLTTQSKGQANGTINQEDMDELNEQWEKLLRARALLKDELKEDGWLIRFRT